MSVGSFVDFIQTGRVEEVGKEGYWNGGCKFRIQFLERSIVHEQ